jgi:hypothetical protein
LQRQTFRTPPRTFRECPTEPVFLLQSTKEQRKPGDVAGFEDEGVSLVLEILARTPDRACDDDDARGESFEQTERVRLVAHRRVEKHVLARKQLEHTLAGHLTAPVDAAIDAEPACQAPDVLEVRRVVDRPDDGKVRRARKLCKRSYRNVETLVRMDASCEEQSLRRRPRRLAPLLPIAVTSTPAGRIPSSRAASRAARTRRVASG